MDGVYLYPLMLHRHIHKWYVYTYVLLSAQLRQTGSGVPFELNPGSGPGLIIPLSSH